MVTESRLLYTAALACCLFVGPMEVRAAEPQVVELQDLKLTIPAAWEKAKEPSSGLRLAEFAIPAAEGDTEASEMVVFPPFGGSIEQNVARWVGQFEGAGRQVSMRKGTSSHGDYVLVDMQGTYKKPVGPPIQGRTALVENYRMLAVILMVEGKGNYFLKVTGPQKTVTGVVDAFRTSYGADKDKEVDYKLSN